MKLYGTLCLMGFHFSLQQYLEILDRTETLLLKNGQQQEQQHDLFVRDPHEANYFSVFQFFYVR